MKYVTVAQFLERVVAGGQQSFYWLRREFLLFAAHFPARSRDTISNFYFVRCYLLFIQVSTATKMVLESQQYTNKSRRKLFGIPPIRPRIDLKDKHAVV